MEVAALGLKVDASGVAAATKELERFTDQGRQAEKAAEGVAAGTRAGIRNSADLAKAVSSLNEEEKKYIQSLLTEAKALTMSRGEKAAYVAANRGMGESAQAVAKALGDKITALKEEQREIAKSATANESFAKSMKVAVGGAQAFLGLQVVSWAKDAAVALFQASAAAERLKIGLDFASSRGGASEIAYLRGVTSELGLAFGTTAKAYMQFQAAAKGTALEGDKARSVFEAVSKASAVMGLSADQSSGALTALQQMVSKGTVASEELRGQLGERLPGSFNIAARAMGVTTAELGKMLEAGQVMSEDFLPKFAKQLEQELGGAAENAAQRLDAAVNRFNNAWEQLKQTAGDSGISKAIAKEMDAVGKDMSVVSEAISNASKSGSEALMSLGAGAAVAVGRTWFAGLNLAANTVNGTINLLTGGILGLNTSLAVLPDSLKSNAEQVKVLQGNVADAEKHLANLQARSEKAGGGAYYTAEIERARGLVAEYRAALAAKTALTGGQSGGIDVGSFPGRGSRANYEKEQEAVRQRGLEITAKADGVTKEYTTTLKVYQDQLKYSLITETQFVQKVTELNKERYESTKAGKEEAKALKSSASEAKAAESEYNKLVASIRGKMEQDKEVLKYGKQLTDAEKLRIMLNEKSLQGATKITAADHKRANALLDQADATEKLLKADQERRKQLEAFEALRTKEADQAAAEVAKIHERASALEDEVANYGRSKDAIEATIIARLEERKAILGGFEGNAAVIAQIDAEIEARKRLASAIGDKAVLDSNKKVFDDLEKKGEQAAKFVGGTLSDYIMGGGKDGVEFLKRLFSTLVLKPVVQYGTQALMGGATGGAESGGIGGLLSSGNSLYNAVSGGLTSSVATGIGSAGAALGSTLMADFAAGMIGGAQMAAPVGMGIGSVGAAGATGAMGAGAAFAAAVPWIAGGLAVASLLGSGMFGSNPKEHAGGAYSSTSNRNDALDVLGLTRHARGDFTERGNADVDNALAGTIGGLMSAYEGLAKRATGAVKELDVYAAFATNPISKDQDAYGYLTILDKVTGEYLRSVSYRDGDGLGNDPAAAFSKFTGNIAGEMVEQLKLADIPGWMANVFDSLGSEITVEGFSSALENIAAIDAGFASLGKSMEIFSGLSGEMQTSLLNVSGGMEALSANAGTYYQQYYSEQERMENLSSQVQNVLSGLDISLDPRLGQQAKDEFRRVVEAAKAGGQGELMAQLLALSGSFATAADYAQKTVEAVGAVGEVLSDVMLGLLQDQRAVEAELLRARGDSEGYTAALRSIATEGYTDAERATWDRIQSLKAEVVALDAAAAATAQVAQERYGLETQLLQVQGNTAALRERELAALNPANRDLQKLIYSLQDAATAAQSAAEAAGAFKTQIQGMLDSVLSGYQGAIQSTSTAVSNLTKYANELLYGTDSGLTGAAQLSALRAEYERVAARAEGGDLAALQSLPEVTTAMLKAEQSMAASNKDYLLALRETSADLRVTGVRGQAAADARALAAAQVMADFFRSAVPGYAVGTPYVPETGLAMLHEGEMVVPRAYNPNAGGTATAVAEPESRTEAVAMIITLRGMLKMLEKWDTDGLPQERAEA